MPLIKYSQYITYPDGSPASNRMQVVSLLGGNVNVPLFTNKAGTIPLANPVLTDAEGLATFYAAPGSFITELVSETFVFLVDAAETDDAWPGTFVHEQLVAAAVWTVDHHIGAPPQVDVISVAGEHLEAEVVHPTLEQTTITFGVPTVGTALLRR